MSILVNPIRKTLTTSSGSASDTFSSTGICLQILVEPTTSSTQYDISITDSSDTVVFSRVDETGTFNELLGLPLAGTYTFSIDNATNDEDNTVFIGVRNS